MLSDQHIHTRFSTDSEADPKEIIECAIARGLSHICFTDHHDIDFPDSGEFQLDLEHYVPAMQSLRDETRGRLDVAVGVELGLMPSTSEKTAATCRDWPFDFVIGSLHILDNKDPYFRDLFPDHTDAALYHKYFEELLCCIRGTSGFHSLGHLDYIVRYGWEREKEYAVKDHEEVLVDILRHLIEHGIALEVNGGGLRSGLPFPNPHPDILRLYRGLGGELITVGSDAHTPEEIAFGFERIRALLLETGFTHIAEFSEGKAHLVPID